MANPLVPFPSAQVRFGERLRFWRERAGLSQVQLAAQLSYDNTLISRLESGRRPVSQQVAQRADRLLGGRRRTDHVGAGGARGADNKFLTGSTVTPGTGPITGAAGKCADITGASSADGTAVILRTCHGGTNQTWTRRSDNTLVSLGKCMNAAGPDDGSAV